MEDPPFVSRQVSDAKRFYLDLNPSASDDLSVVCGGVERMSPEYIVDRSDFKYFAIEWVTEGEGSLQLNGKQYRLRPGSVFAYGPGVHHVIQNHPANPMRKYYLDFAGSEARHLLRCAGLDQWTLLRVSGLHEIVEFFDLLLREAKEDSLVSRKICTALTRTLFLKIEQRRISDGHNLPRAIETFERVRKYIDLNFHLLHSVEDVASQCRLTPIYISRLFRRFRQMGAYDYLLRQKMHFAAELLTNERLLVKQVAVRLGFADAFQFSRAFKRVYGVAPKTLTQLRDPQKSQ